MRFERDLLLAITPCAGDYDQQAIAESPGNVGPSSLLVMARSLIVERAVENKGIDDEESAHPQEVASFGPTGGKQSANEETDRNQAVEKDPGVQSANLHTWAKSHRRSHPCPPGSRDPRNSVRTMGTIQKKTRTSLGQSVPRGA